ALVTAGNFDEGLHFLEAAKNVNPSNRTALFNYTEALVELKEGSEKQALDALEGYLALRSEDHEMWARCADIALRPNYHDKDKARQCLINAIDLEPREGRYLQTFLRSISPNDDRKELTLYQRWLDRLRAAELSSGFNKEYLVKALTARVSLVF